jgi:hypothetical protein
MSSERLFEAIMAAPGISEKLTQADARRIAYELSEAIGTSTSDMEQLRREWVSARADATRYAMVLSSIFGASPDRLVLTDSMWWNTESRHFGITAAAAVTHAGLLAAKPDGFHIIAGPGQPRPDLNPAGWTESDHHWVDDDGFLMERVLCYWPDWTPLTDLPSWLQPVTHPDVLGSKTQPE